MSEPGSTISSTIRAAAGAGALVGVLDSIAACLHAWGFWRLPPARVWRFVAGGALGKGAATGGSAVVAVGLLFHFVIAIGWTALFFVAARALRLPLRTVPQALGIGAAYGFLVWLAMSFVVVPLSKIGSRPLQLNAPTVVMILIHVVVIGGSIGLLARRALAAP